MNAGGAEDGVGLLAGTSAELVDCSLALTARGMAVTAQGPAASAVLRSCRVEGCAAAGETNGEKSSGASWLLPV